MSFIRRNNGLNQSVILVSCVLIILLCYSFAYKQIPFLQDKVKDLPELKRNSKKLFRNKAFYAKIKIRNTIMTAFQLQTSDEVKFHLDSLKNYNNYTGIEHLSFFIEALNNSNTKTVRVAYIGDSSIEGDLMSMSLRKFLQAKFGGQGVGYMPISSNVAGFRTSIIHSFSDNWQYASIVIGNKSNFNYGFSGEIFYPYFKSNKINKIAKDSPTNDSIQKGIILGDSFNITVLSKDTSKIDSITNENTILEEGKNLWVNYTAKNEDFINTKLYYGKNHNSTLPNNKLIFNSKVFNLKETKVLNELVLSSEPIKHAKLNFEMNHSIPIYGTSFESSTGVLVDNFSSRGNSGMVLTKISSQMLKDFNAYLDYDLIILQFGLNALGTDPSDNYSWYIKQMKNVVAHYKTALPNASIILVSVGDKSLKNENGLMTTSPEVEKMIAAQKKIARESEVAFFNLFEIMGGKNSMTKWVEELKFANKDYTHFNFKGADVAADSLYQFLMNAYEENDD